MNDKMEHIARLQNLQRKMDLIVGFLWEIISILFALILIGIFIVMFVNAFNWFAK